MAKEKTIGGTILKIVLIVATVIVVGVLALFLIAKYFIGIDIIGAYSSLKKLGTQVNTETIITYPYADNKMADSLNNLFEINAGQGGIVSGSGENLTVDYERLEGLEFSASLELTDKQLAAIINASFNKYINSNQLEEQTADLMEGLEISQIKFSNYVVEGGLFKSVDVQTVVKFPLESIKAFMTGFPLSLFRDMLPNDLYLDTTITITKDYGEAWKYSLKAKDTKINNMTNEEATALVKSISGILGVNDADELGVTFGEVLIDAIIGNTEEIGLGSGLLNAKDFSFKKTGETIYYVIEFIL